MGQRLIVILALILMIRPIALAENFACGDKTATSENSPLTKEAPCPDVPQPFEIIESGHHCPCFALLQPDSVSLTANTKSFIQVARTTNLAKTAVATPPTPPPRLV